MVDMITSGDSAMNVLSERLRTFRGAEWQRGKRVEDIKIGSVVW